MYNRYIPRGDGSYICRQEPDFEPVYQGRQEPPPEPIPQAEITTYNPGPGANPGPGINQGPGPGSMPEQKVQGSRNSFGLGNITEMIRGILPKNIDVGDILLVLILILLLIEGEDDEMLWILLIMLIL